MSARSDAEKRAEQTRIAAGYQHDADRRRRQRDGVAVTPVEVVDFQILSLIQTLKTQHGIDPDEGVEWLDPFGGTGIYIARLLQLAPLSPGRKAVLASHCVVIEIDPRAAQICANNLAVVYREETRRDGHVRVICTDTFRLPPDADLFDPALPVVRPDTHKTTRKPHSKSV